MADTVGLAVQRDRALHAREPLPVFARVLGDERPPAGREHHDVLIRGRGGDRTPIKVRHWSSPGILMPAAREGGAGSPGARCASWTKRWPCEYADLVSRRCREIFPAGYAAARARNAPA